MGFCSWIRDLVNSKTKVDNNLEDKIYLNKRALIVGINRYSIPGADLRGCVNDALGMANVLHKFFDFPKSNMKILLDEDAKKINIIDGIKWLIDNAKPGEELVFHYSGHGSQIPDFDNDEVDKLDEILVPHDMNWRDKLQISDDVIYNIFKNLPKDVFLTMICDSCHSGTMTRAVGSVPLHKPRFVMPPADIMTKVVNMKSPFVNKLGEKQRAIHVSPQRHILLSGCKESQTSADALINGKWQGALTSALITEIYKTPTTNWKVIHNKVISRLKQQGFDQDPQLRGGQFLLERNIFGG